MLGGGGEAPAEAEAESSAVAQGEPSAASNEPVQQRQQARAPHPSATHPNRRRD